MCILQHGVCTHLEEVFLHIGFQPSAHHHIQGPLPRIVTLRGRDVCTLVCVCVCVCVLEDREDICEVLCSTKKFELPTISASLLCSSCFSASSIFLFSSGEKYFSTVISLSCGITQAQRHTKIMQLLLCVVIKLAHVHPNICTPSATLPPFQLLYLYM